MIQEVTLFAAATGANVDRENGMLLGVSVITGGVEAKGHDLWIDQTTLEQVMECSNTYPDGLRVKMDHGTGIDSLVGVLKNFRIDGHQLRADLQLIKSHEDYSKILEMAETISGSFGLSIVFSGEPEKVQFSKDEEDEEGEDFTSAPSATRWMARCLEIYSCDIVDMPACNPSGLFSKKLMSEKTETEVTPVADPAPVETPIEVSPVIETLTPATEDAPVEVIADPVADDAPAIEEVVIVEEVEVAPIETPIDEILETANALASRQDEFGIKITALDAEVATTKILLAAKETAITELSSALAAKEIELAALRGEAEETKSKHTKLGVLHESLKKSLGLLPAVNIPAAAILATTKDASDYRAEYSSIKDPTARAAYFKRNMDAMLVK